jgi:hypothetical protein
MDIVVTGYPVAQDNTVIFTGGLPLVVATIQHSTVKRFFDDPVATLSKLGQPEVQKRFNYPMKEKGKHPWLCFPLFRASLAQTDISPAVLPRCRSFCICQGRLRAK